MSILERLQDWFQSQCDGQWEHDRGVRIDSTDNPGWWVKIDLNGTLLAAKHFSPVRRGDVESTDPEPPWMHCYIEAGVFNGAGDPNTLNEILTLFLDWATSVPPS
jgi:hypothetical protein